MLWICIGTGLQRYPVDYRLAPLCLGCTLESGLPLVNLVLGTMYEP